MNPLLAMTLLATLGSALAAGVFFAFSTFVMQGFVRLPPGQGMAAMQSVNVTAVRPMFMTQLFGTALLCVGLGVWAIVKWSPASKWLIAGALAYLICVIVMTIVFHVPRNDRLAALDANTVEGQAYWTQYQREWTLGNHLRTIGSLAATALFAQAMRS